MTHSPAQILIFTVTEHGPELEGDIVFRKPLDLETVSYAISFFAALMIEKVGQEKAAEVIESLVADHASEMEIGTCARN